MAISRGASLGPYEILGPLGAGGMGEVWRARDSRLDREVALKVLPEDFLEDGQRRARFEREARLLAALSHPAVAAIYAFEEIPGSPARHVLAMELLHGETLREALRSGPLPEPRIREVGATVADGLAAAHASGIVHRDLKPENLFIRSDGQVKILDFGLAKREAPSSAAESTAPTAAKTEAGTILGTSGYMSPEQVTGAPTDARTDVFALGCVLHEMASGRRTFSRPTLAETLAAVLRDEPAPLGGAVSAALERVIGRCLEKRPEDRFQSARDLAFALRENLTETPAPRAPKAGRAWRAAAVAAAAVGLLAAGVWLSRTGARSGGGSSLRSLAVLPFENLSSDPAQASLADAMTESLTTNLGRASALRVVSRGAVVSLASTGDPAAKVGAALGVEALVTGSIQKSGDSLRVNVQIVEVASGRQLWSAPFAQVGGSLFALQDRVSREIFGALHVVLTPAERTSLRGAPTASLEAYDHYVRGRLHVRRENPEDNAAAISELEKAVALDASFAAAHAELARAYGLRAFYIAPDDRTLIEKAEVAAAKSLSLDPDLGQAHYARGLLLWTPANRFPHEQAIEAYQRAIALDPNHDDAHHQLALIELHIGLLDSAAGEFAAARRLDPTNTLAHHRSGLIPLYQFRYTEALKVFKDTPREFNPSLLTYHVALTELHLGQRSEAASTIAEFRRTGNRDRGGVVSSVDAIVSALAADVPATEKLAAESVAAGRNFGHFHHAAYNLACAYALIGRNREALEWLRSAAASGLPCYPLFAKDPYLDGVRKDPDFLSFLEAQRRDWTARKALVKSTS